MKACRQISIIAFLFVVTACSPGLGDASTKKHSEFNALCEVYTKIVKQADFPGLSSEDRTRKLESELAPRLGSAGDAHIAWTAIQNAPPSEHYYLFKEAAKSAGYGTWVCPAIKDHGHEIGSNFN